MFIHFNEASECRDLLIYFSLFIYLLSQQFCTFSVSVNDFSSDVPQGLLVSNKILNSSSLSSYSFFVCGYALRVTQVALIIYYEQSHKLLVKPNLQELSSFFFLKKCVLSFQKTYPRFSCFPKEVNTPSLFSFVTYI